MIRAIRGAITVTENTREQILGATQELLLGVIEANGLTEENLISIVFTVTNDLNAAFPAEAARILGWADTPFLCATEIPVAGSLPRCIRILLHCHADLTKGAVKHVYLREAVRLRPDLAKGDVS